MYYKRPLIAAFATVGLLTGGIAMAQDNSTAETLATAAISTAEVSKDQAATANRVAADAAVKAVLVQNRLDLDIRLIGPTSVKIASKR